MTQRDVIKNLLQDFLAILEEEKHRVDHNEKIEKKGGRSRGHSGSSSYKQRTRALGRRTHILHQLLLTRNMIGERWKFLHQPIVRIKSTGGAQVLADPRNRLIAYVERLLNDDSEKYADGANHEDERISRVTTAPR